MAKSRRFNGPNTFPKWLKVYNFLSWWAIPHQRVGEACQNLIVAWAEWQNIPEESRLEDLLAANAIPGFFFNLAKKKFPHLNKPDPRESGYGGQGGRGGSTSTST
ncbi:hypothetical protein OCU04_007791 [Sclerotinia nivalis]|uniref:Uncharacterized protein n=1 Tax=Sclerotinia nivalis TaxID=352851 RepID=A0A9X0AJH4_9HELO|nr:hypothetical protein OCU04_007791 [Sclerotinia nivalis]